MPSMGRADQTTNAALVEASGAGVALISGSGSVEENVKAVMGSKETLRSVVTKVLETPTFREAAQLIARELLGADTPATVIDRLVAMK